MFTNLEDSLNNDIISSKEYIKGERERIYYGVCKSDLYDFSAYLDEVILNALIDLTDNHKTINIPKPYSKEEWLNILEEMINLAENITTNNYIEYNYEVKSEEQLEEAYNKIDELQADSYAYRKKLYEMLSEHIADMYIL